MCSSDLTGHLRQLRQLARGPQDAAKLRLLRSYDPAAGTRLDVPDPYYGGGTEFEQVLELIEAAMPRLIRDIKAALAAEPEDTDEADESLDEDADADLDANAANVRLNGGGLRR